jgi:hypothetical protein
VAVAVVLTLVLALVLDSERTATAAVERRSVHGRSNSTRPVAEGLGGSQLFPLAAWQHDLGLVLVRAGFVEVLAAQHAELVRHAVPVAVRLVKPKCFHS